MINCLVISVHNHIQPGLNTDMHSRQCYLKFVCLSWDRQTHEWAQDKQGPVCQYWSAQSYNPATSIYKHSPKISAAAIATVFCTNNRWLKRSRSICNQQYPPIASHTIVWPSITKSKQQALCVCFKYTSFGYLSHLDLHNCSRQQLDPAWLSAERILNCL